MPGRRDSLDSSPGVPLFEPQYTLSPQLVRQLVQIERACGFLDAVDISPEWSQRVRDECRVDDALSSVQIEGASLTRHRAAQLAESGAEAASNDEQEFLNYYAAFNAIDGIRGDRSFAFSARDLHNLHGMIVRDTRGHRHAGRFRDGPVVIGDRDEGVTTVHHEPPEAEAVPALVDELLAWLELAKVKRAAPRYGRDDTWVHPVIVAGVAQHRLVWIHPFFDGNGRTARMFTTALLYQRRYDFKYLFDLSTWYNRDREKYYDKLRSADRTGDYTEWLVYFAGGLSNQLANAQRRAREVGRGLVTGEGPAD